MHTPASGKGEFNANTNFFCAGRSGGFGDSTCNLDLGGDLFDLFGSTLETHLELSVMVSTAECVQGNFEGFPNRAEVVHHRLQNTHTHTHVTPSVNYGAAAASATSSLSVCGCNYLGSVHK